MKEQPDNASGPRIRTCPICGKATLHAYRPFCSRRCADIDLARWLGGTYAIPGEDPAPPATNGQGEDGDRSTSGQEESERGKP